MWGRQRRVGLAAEPAASQPAPHHAPGWCPQSRGPRAAAPKWRCWALPKTRRNRGGGVYRCRRAASRSTAHITPTGSAPLYTGDVALHCPKRQVGGRGGPRPALTAVQRRETSIAPAERQEDGMQSYMVFDGASRGTHLKYGKQVAFRRRVDAQCTVPNLVGQKRPSATATWVSDVGNLWVARLVFYGSLIHLSELRHVSNVGRQSATLLSDSLTV